MAVQLYLNSGYHGPAHSGLIGNTFNMENIFTRHEHYARAFPFFRRKSTQKEMCGNWLNEHILQLATPTCSDSDQLRVLSVGTGQGELDDIILKKLTPKYNNIHYTTVEPNDVENEYFRSHVANQPSNHNVSFQMEEMLSDGFLEKLKEGSTYHLVHFIHSLYSFVNNLPETLNAYYDLLPPGGILFSITNFSGQGFSKVVREFQDRLPTLEYVSAEDIDAALQEQGIPYTKEKILSVVDITTAFEDNEHGNLLLDFLSHVYKFRENAPPELVEAFVQRLKEVAIEENGKCLLYIRSDVHIIRKPNL